MALKLNSALIYPLSSIRRSIETARNYSQREPHGNSARNLPNDAPWAPPIITLICSRVKEEGERGPALDKWQMGWAIGKLDFYALPGGCKQTNQLWIIIAHQSFSQSAPLPPPSPSSLPIYLFVWQVPSQLQVSTAKQSTQQAKAGDRQQEQAKFQMQELEERAVGGSRAKGGMP